MIAHSDWSDEGKWDLQRWPKKQQYHFLLPVQIFTYNSVLPYYFVYLRFLISYTLFLLLCRNCTIAENMAQISTFVSSFITTAEHPTTKHSASVSIHLLKRFCAPLKKNTIDYFSLWACTTHPEDSKLEADIFELET